MSNQSDDRLKRCWPDVAQACVALAAVCAVLRGQPAGGWAAGLIGMHVALYAALPSYGGRMRQRWLCAWQAASEFPIANRQIPWAAAVLLIVLPDALFLLLRDRGIQSGDSRPVVMTAASLARAGDAELSEFVDSYVTHRLFTATDAAPYFFLPCPGGIYSHYPSGMVAFALPVVASARLIGCDLSDPTVHERLEKLTASGVSAACLGMFFLIALHLVGPRAACAAVALLATGSVMFSTVGQALWQHGGVIFWMELLLLVEFRSFQQPTWKSIALQGLCCGMMLACRLSSGLIVVSFGLWLLARSPARAALVAGAAVLAVLPWTVANQSIYGSPLGPMAVQTQGNFWSFTDLGAWSGVLFSPTHGLLIYQPWLWLALYSAVPAWRAAPVRVALPRGWQVWAAAVIVLHLSLVSGWRCWWGGWCWGSRLASEAVPLGALLVLNPLAALLASDRGRRFVFALGLAAALLHVPSVYLQQGRWYGGIDSDRDTASLWRWSSPPFLFPLRR